MYRFSPCLILAASSLLIGVGCSRTDTTRGEASRDITSPKNTGTAFVRYVSAMDAHTNSDLYFGDLRLFSTAGAENPTGYKEVPAERRDFVLREAGKPDGVEIEKNSEGLSANKHYTVVAFEDKDGKPVLRAFNDDESAPSAGKAKVRLIHAAPAVDPVSLYAPGRTDKLAGESRFSTGSKWQQVDPVNGPFEVRTGNDKTGLQASVPVDSLKAGKLYTLVVEGGPKSGKPLRVVSFTDSPTS